MRLFVLSTLTVLLGTIVVCHAQSSLVKNYFLPKEPVVQCVLDHPSKDNQGPAWKTFIVYTKKGSGYQIFSKQEIGGRTGTFSEQTVVFVGNEVKIVRLRSKTMMGEKDKTFSPARTLFKIPVVGQKASWSDPASVDITKCVAERTTITVNGESVPAIKVVKQTYDSNGKPISWAKTIEYYAQNIGLYQIKYKDGSTMAVFNEAFSEDESSVPLINLLPASSDGSKITIEPSGSLHSSSLYGGVGGSGMRPGSRSGGLEMSGWRLENPITVPPFDETSGAVRFRIQINDDGEVESVVKVSGNVSPEQEKLCRNKLLSATFTKTNDSASAATGYFTFKFIAKE